MNLDFLWQRPGISENETNAGKAKQLRALPVFFSAGSGLAARRQASSDSHSWFRRLFDSRSRKKQSTLQPDDLPPLSAFLEEGADTSVFNYGRTVTGKASNELKLRCTEFDADGNVTLVSGEFKKSELIAKVIISSAHGPLRL